MQGVWKKFRIQAPNASFIIYHSYGQKVIISNSQIPQKKHTKTECEGTTTTTLSTIGIKEEEEAHRVLHAECGLMGA